MSCHRNIYEFQWAERQGDLLIMRCWHKGKMVHVSITPEYVAVLKRQARPIQEAIVAREQSTLNAL